MGRFDEFFKRTARVSHASSPCLPSDQHSSYLTPTSVWRQVTKQPPRPSSCSYRAKKKQQSAQPSRPPWKPKSRKSGYTRSRWRQTGTSSCSSKRHMGKKVQRSLRLQSTQRHSISLQVVQGLMLQQCSHCPVDARRSNRFKCVASGFDPEAQYMCTDWALYFLFPPDRTLDNTGRLA